MRQIVFVCPGRVGVCASRVFNSLGVRTWCFRPQVDVDESLPFGMNAGESVDGLSRVVQRTYDRVLHWFRNSLPDDVAIAVVGALEKDADSSWNSHEFAREVRAALVSRLMRDAWDVVFLDHAVSRFRNELLLVVKSKRSASVLRQEFGYRVVRVPNVSFLRYIQFLRKARVSRRGADAVQVAGGVGPKLGPVGLLRHKGSSYGSLYRWEQYFDPSNVGPLSRENVREFEYRDFLSLSLTGRNLARVVLPVIARFVRFSLGTRKLQGELGPGILFEVCRLMLEVRVATLVIADKAKEIKVMLYSYEMLVPPSLSLALRLRGITRIANLERPTVYLYHLPVLLDTYLVPDDVVEERVRKSESIIVSRFVKVGYWRTDFFFEHNDHRVEDGFDVVVFPYHVVEDKTRRLSDMITSEVSMKSFLLLVAQVAAEFSDLRFVVRAKNPDWISVDSLRSVNTRLLELGNVVMDIDYSEEGRSYILARAARLVVGKYSTILDECGHFGVPFVVHDFLQDGSREFDDCDLAISPTCIARKEADFVNQVRRAISGRSELRPERNSLCDGSVRKRIRDEVLGALSTSR